MKRLTNRVAVSVITAVAVVVAAAVGIAQSATPFGDVSNGHDRSADIRAVAAAGWFGGYPDGSFKPDRTITADQMATVIGRAFPGGLSRSEFASFMVGGNQRVEHNPNGEMITVSADASVPIFIRAAGTYRFNSSTTDRGTITLLDDRAQRITTLASSRDNRDTDTRSQWLDVGQYLIEISKKGRVSWELLPPECPVIVPHSGSVAAPTDRTEIVSIPAGTYRFVSAVEPEPETGGFWRTRDTAMVRIRPYEGNDYSWHNLATTGYDGDEPDMDERAIRLDGGEYIVEIQGNGSVRWETYPPACGR